MPPKYIECIIENVGSNVVLSNDREKILTVRSTQNQNFIVSKEELRGSFKTSDYFHLIFSRNKSWLNLVQMCIKGFTGMCFTWREQNSRPTRERKY